MDQSELWSIGIVTFAAVGLALLGAKALAAALRRWERRVYWAPDAVKWVPTTLPDPDTPDRRPVVILHIGMGGAQETIWAGDVDVYCIDENCQGDRVYRYGAGGRSFADIETLIGEDEIGSLGDRPAAEQAIRAAFFRHQGKRPSLVVSDDPEGV